LGVLNTINLKENNATDVSDLVTLHGHAKSKQGVDSVAVTMNAGTIPQEQGLDAWIVMEPIPQETKTAKWSIA